jgi:WD40 repeat protein
VPLKPQSGDVLKGRDRRNARVSLLCCDFDSTGARIAAGAADGSLQMWKIKTTGRYVRPDMIIRPAHDAQGAEVSGVAFSPDGTLLASRAANDDCVKVWDVRKTANPLFCFADLPNRSPHANVAFSANGSLLVTGTSAMERPTMSGSDKDEDKEVRTWDMYYACLFRRTVRYLFHMHRVSIYLTDNKCIFLNWRRRTLNVVVSHMALICLLTMSQNGVY